MARCMRCNKFMLFSSKSGYCASCDILIINEKAATEKKAREDLEKRLQEEAALLRAEEERQHEAEEARKVEEERQRKAEEARKTEEDRQRKAEEARKAEEKRQRRAEEARKAEEERQRKAEEARKAEEEIQRKNSDSSLDSLTKGAMKEAAEYLAQVLDLMKTIFAYSCKDFTVSYRLSEASINNYVQLRFAIIEYFAKLIAAVNTSIGVDQSETALMVEQLVGEELATGIDYSGLVPLDLANPEVPWVEKLFFDIDDFSLNDSKLHLSSLTFSPVFLKMVISITGRIQHLHIDKLSQQANKCISEYTDVLKEYYLDEAERITGKRPQISFTSATISKNDDGTVTNIVVKEKEGEHK